MAVSIRSNLTGNTFITGGSTTIYVAVPGSIAAGDIIVAVIVHASVDSLVTYTTPTGFTQTLPPTFNGTSQTGMITVFTKVATGTESGTWTFIPSEIGSGWTIVTFSVAGASSIFGNSGANTNSRTSYSQGSSIPLNGPSVATGGTGNFVLWVGAGTTTAGTGGASKNISGTTVPSGFTQTNATYAPTTGYTFQAIAVAGYTDPSSHTVSYNGSFTAGTGGLTFETYIFELILIPAPPIKMYANGAFQAAQFIESSSGPAMRMYSNNLVQVGKMIELPAIIGATQNLFFAHTNTGPVPVPPGSVGDLLILAATGSINTDIPTFPTGFTQISANLDMTGANNTHYNGYYTIFAIKTADGTESGNFTISWNTYGGIAILCLRVAGVGSTLLANTTNSNLSYFGTTTTTVNTTITTPSNNNFIVAIGTWEYPGSGVNGVSMPSIFNQTMAIPTPNPSNGSPSNYYWVSGGVQPTAGTQTYPFTGNFPVVYDNFGGVALLAFPLSIPASTQKLYSNGAFVSSQFIE